MSAENRVAIDDAHEALRVAGLNLRSLFDRFPFAVQVFAPDGRPAYVNPAYAALWGFGPEDDPRLGYVLVENRRLEDLGVMRAIRRGFAGESVAIPPTRYTVEDVPTLPDGKARWLRTFLYPVHGDAGETRAVVVMHIDVTALEEAQQTLESTVEERTRESATLLDASRALASTLELSPLISLALEQLKAVADYDGATIMVLEGDDLVVLEDRGGIGPDVPNPELLGARWSVADDSPIWHAMRERAPVTIDDVQGDGPFAREFRSINRDFLETPAIRHVRSWLAVPMVARDRVVGMIGISRDEPGYYTENHARLATAIAAHVAAAVENARLYEEERRAADERATLLEVGRTVTSTIELERLLGVILEQLKRVVDYVSATIMTRDGDRFVMREYRGPLPREIVLSRTLAGDLAADMWEEATLGEPLVIPDVWADEPNAVAFRGLMGEGYLRTTASYLRTQLTAPLIAKGRLMGLLTLSHHTPGFFTERHAVLARAIADQAAVAIENAQLYEQQRRTAQELATLLEVSRNLSATLDLPTLLDAIIDQAKVVADYDGASILTIDDSALQIIYRRGPGETDPTYRRGLKVSLERAALFYEYMFRRQCLIIDDVRADEPLARAYRQMMGGDPAEIPYLRYVRSWLGVPLALHDRVIGVLVLAHSTPGYYTSHHAELVSAIASQAAAAIENARLYEQAGRVAALEERQRLARELHDSVSQVLFSIGLGARSARTLAERGDPERLLSAIDYIANLAETGTAEMRALLFELRPESLAQEGLVAAIGKQAAALRARHGIVVDAALGEEPQVSLDVKEALYRIAQEATHNTVKHARAGHVTVRLGSEDGSLALDVIDDGAGFDAGGDFPGHLGLRSMRERVASLGGTIRIESAPGAGSAIRVRVPMIVSASDRAE